MLGSNRYIIEFSNNCCLTKNLNLKALMFKVVYNSNLNFTIRLKLRTKSS